jgi:hypothetical protein
MCDRMVEMLKESGVEQLEQPKSIWFDVCVFDRLSDIIFTSLFN